MLPEHPLEGDLNHILAHMGDLWEELRATNIFLTGGTGFFGCWLLESFVRANETFGLHASVTVLTRNVEAFQKKAPHLASHPAIRFHIGDVKTFIFPEDTFSHIIHASNEAAALIEKKETPERVRDSIIQAARHTLEFAGGCGCRHLLFTSSGSVYGPQPADVLHIPETFTGIRDTSTFRYAHGEGKYVAETLCADYAKKYGFTAKIARCFSFVGPYMPLDKTYAIGNFIGNVINNEDILIEGDGTPFRSYLYAADLAVWLWTVLFRGGSCRPYNVGSEEGLTIAQVARTVAEIAHAKQEIHILKKAEPGRTAERYVPSVRRARQELGLKQHIGLKDAIRRTISWHLGQQL